MLENCVILFCRVTTRFRPTWVTIVYFLRNAKCITLRVSIFYWVPSIIYFFKLLFLPSLYNTFSPVKLINSTIYSKLGYCLMYFMRAYFCKSFKSNFNFLFDNIFHSLSVVDTFSVVQEFYDGSFQVSLFVFFYPPGFLKSETLP